MAICKIAHALRALAEIAAVFARQVLPFEADDSNI